MDSQSREKEENKTATAPVDRLGGAKVQAESGSDAAGARKWRTTKLFRSGNCP